MPTNPPISNQKSFLTVQQLNQLARDLLEDGIGSIWVKGELSSVKLHGSGHYYFTLKDEHAQIPCVMFRGSARNLSFTLEEGMAVLLRAKVTIYEQGGRYQLLVEEAEQWGLGKLQQAFEALKAKLQAEGLFAEEHKKPLPRFPLKIGIITSKSAAALQDILSVLKRRYPIAELTLYHTDVQGKTAGQSIAKAISRANHAAKVEVLILSRGGGSLEDLWAFNEEIVARAIFKSQIPIISGVGHEVDFTIADFVADIRAPTPSAAAETVAPHHEEIYQLFENLKTRLKRDIERQLQHYIFKVDSLEKRLLHPGQQIKHALLRLQNVKQMLELCMTKCLKREEHHLVTLAAKLHAYSPLATMSRGYAIVTDLHTGNVIKQISDLAVNQKIKTKLFDGDFEAVVTSIH